MSDLQALPGKVAIVTGSAKATGIGAGIALALAKAGAQVVINYVSDSRSDEADRTVAHIHKSTGRTGCAIAVKADISNPEGAKALVDGTLKGFGVDHIDIIVNNAVGGGPGMAVQSTPELLHHTFSVNVYGPLYILQHAVSYMGNGGRVVNIGSVASKLGMPGTSLYGASKAAMGALTYTLANELCLEGKTITVNMVMPGPVPTDGVPTDARIQSAHDRLVSMTRAERRLGTVEDIADVVLFLASEKSRWVTGQVISVSGGITGGH